MINSTQHVFISGNNDVGLRQEYTVTVDTRLVSAEKGTPPLVRTWAILKVGVALRVFVRLVSYYINFGWMNRNSAKMGYV